MPAADDAAEIWPRLMRLRRICFHKLELPVQQCWCWKAGPDGQHIPCCEANDPTGFDLLGKPGAATPKLTERWYTFNLPATEED